MTIGVPPGRVVIARSIPGLAAACSAITETLRALRRVARENLLLLLLATVYFTVARVVGLALRHRRLCGGFGDCPDLVGLGRAAHLVLRSRGASDR